MKETDSLLFFIYPILRKEDVLKDVSEEGWFVFHEPIAVGAVVHFEEKRPLVLIQYNVYSVQSSRIWEALIHVTSFN